MQGAECVDEVVSGQANDHASLGAVPALATIDEEPAVLALAPRDDAPVGQRAPGAVEVAAQNSRRHAGDVGTRDVPVERVEVLDLAPAVAGAVGDVRVEQLDGPPTDVERRREKPLGERHRERLGRRDLDDRMAAGGEDEVGPLTDEVLRGDDGKARGLELRSPGVERSVPDLLGRHRVGRLGKDRACLLVDATIPVDVPRDEREFGHCCPSRCGGATPDVGKRETRPTHPV